MVNLNPAIQFLPELEQLPLIITGPILRHVQTDSVTVWLALKHPETVSLKVLQTESGHGSQLAKTIFQGQQQTIALGKNLHVLAITAIPLENAQLTPGEVYAYDLYFHQTQLNLVQVLNSGQKPSRISYFQHQLPTFSLPPRDLNYLRIVHGSCRKPHGGGLDALSCLDNLIQDAASLANQRPHQLFLTGDQIYGDDVADAMLWLCQGVSQLLLGWSEELPLEDGSMLNHELPPGQRTAIAQIEAGMTGMLGGKEDKAKSHLFSFGEYAAAYLIAWSPVLVPQTLPDGASIGLSPQRAKVWQSEIEATSSFLAGLERVRRGLANIPVYTICDDHEVSDDWYLNRSWCDRVLSKPLGKRIVQNALLTYAIFQAWGSTPANFAPGTNGAKLLQLGSQWSLSAGKDLQAKRECDRYLGIPNNDPQSNLPRYQLDQDVLILAREPEAIPWYYTIKSASHEVILLDTRNWRGYPQGENELAPPMLLSPSAFQQQLHQPLAVKSPQIAATIVVLPTNLIALGIIDRIQRYELSHGRVFSNDVGDSWNFHETAFLTLLLNLCRERDRVIILSGDIHYSCAVRVLYCDRTSQQTAIIAQLTSSAIKNSELATRVIHTKLKSLFPEPTQHWFGWHQPLKQIQVPKSRLWNNSPVPRLIKPGLPLTKSVGPLNINSRRTAQAWWETRQDVSSPETDHCSKSAKKLWQQAVNADWQYQIEWIKRKPAESLPWRERKTFKSPVNIFQQIINKIVTLLWRNRWLQEGREVIGKNNLSLVRFNWSGTKQVIQETYWYPPWQATGMVKSRYEILLEERQNPD